LITCVEAEIRDGELLEPYALYRDLRYHKPRGETGC
jgi:hypothetical protein